MSGTGSDQLKTDSNISYIESGILIAILTAGCYFIGVSNLVGYYSRFGLYFSMLNLTPEEIIIDAKEPILFCFCIGIIFLFGIGWQGREDHASWIVSNLPFFILLLDWIIYLFSPLKTRVPGNLPIVIMLIILPIIGLIIAWHYFKTKNKNILRDCWNLGSLGKIIVLFLLLISLAYLAADLGQYKASTDIECNIDFCSHVNFTFNDTNNSYVNSQNLILITHRDNKFYVTERMNPAPVTPEVYIIPDDAVEVVKIESIQNWNSHN